MTLSLEDEDIVLRLEILGYYKFEVEGQLHFVDSSRVSSYKGTHSNIYRILHSSYVYSFEEGCWIKNRSKLEKMIPLTSAERILYGKK